MKIEVLSFDGSVFKSNRVVSINTVTKSWEITVLENHTPLITSIVPSVLTVNYIYKWTETTREFAVWRWILEVWENSSKILLDMLIASEDLDLEKAEEARKRALEIMEKYKNTKDKTDMEKFIKAEDALLKSLAQLKIGKQ